MPVIIPMKPSIPSSSLSQIQQLVLLPMCYSCWELKISRNHWSGCIRKGKRKGLVLKRRNRTCELEGGTERNVSVSETEIERSQRGPGLMGRTLTDTETVKVKQTRKEYHLSRPPTRLLLQSGGETLELSNRELSMTVCIVPIHHIMVDCG